MIQPAPPDDPWDVPASRLDPFGRQVARPEDSAELRQEWDSQPPEPACSEEVEQALEPAALDALVAQGLALAAQEDYMQAGDVFAEVVRRYPQLALGHFHKANAEFANQQFDAAVASYRQALSRQENSLEDIVVCLNNLGAALAATRQWDLAVDTFRRAVAEDRHALESRINLARALLCRKDLAEAIHVCHEVIQLDSGRADGFAVLGQCWQHAGMYDHAMECFGQALTRNPEEVDLYVQLGNVQAAAGQLTAAVDSYQQAVDAVPDYAEVYSNLAELHRITGQLSQAVEQQQRALTINPQLHETHSNLLLTWQYRGDVRQAELSAEARQWAAAHAGPVVAGPAFPAAPAPRRRLRLGYVSADFRSHPVGYFLEPVLARHNREHFEVHAFASQLSGDAITEKIVQHADHWYDASDWTDEELAERIRMARIDILIDLSGHTSGNRLLVFAARPAPVQATWAGYVHTTGLQAMDYLIGDHTITPPADQPWFSETLIRLPRPYVCFAEPTDTLPAKPAETASPAPFTFGCFNNLAKLTPEVVETWAAILQAVPEAVLFLKTKSLGDEVVRRRYLEEFGQRGVAASQLRWEGYSPREELLAAYRDVDLALDPFPFNGGITTLEALWMGVPVLTCRGQRLAARVGESYLGCLGLQDLVAADRQQYMERAVEIARSRCLPAVGASLRRRLLDSPLCDCDGFTVDLENALRDMWCQYCSTK